MKKAKIRKSLCRNLCRKFQKKKHWQGAERGTAYHRVFELLDMEKENYGEETVSYMLEQMAADKKLSKIQADCIAVADIAKFCTSDVFLRMKSAYERGELFRGA